MAEDERREALNDALREGLAIGPAEPFDWDGFMERHFGDAA